MVYPLRLELRSAANRAAVLATGRQVQNWWCSERDSNPRFLVCRTRALAARRPEQQWCAREESNLDLNLRRVAPSSVRRRAQKWCSPAESNCRLRFRKSYPNRWTRGAKMVPQWILEIQLD